MHSNCIATEALLPGMVIVQVTKQNGPVKIRKSGLVTSTDMIQGLIEMGIQEVQIDPTQTVEIETPLVQSSLTLQLLQSGSGMPNRQDKQSHDQFNRSLFLPSVQDIPSAWQFYARRYALLTLTILCGLAVGYAVAYVPNILSLRSPLVIADAPPTEALKGGNSEAKILESPTNTNELPTEKAPSVSTPAGTLPGGTLPAGTEDITAQDSEVATVEAVVQPQPTQVTTASTLVVSQSSVNSPVSQIIESAQSTGPSSQPNKAVEPQLSPELVKRFENVIKQMDKEAASGNSLAEPIERITPNDSQIRRSPVLTPPTSETRSQDVPRIDQLPAWVMNELPSMSFSAHMYSSDPAERWVRVNGQRMLEGALIDNKVRIVQIASQHVILNYQGHEFSMLSMTDW
ncbi:general secretion pathway protein GspB [Paraglaciecola sp. 25GB23A]|uniref:general secretion pathway protein GspB n=1 Tax=Paraglaciecola sp. 25GB23A TaxID=3156068 RepID=UPI0032B00AF6